MLATPTQEQIMTSDAVEAFSGSILDVRTPESFAEEHINGSQNYSVYQTDFLQKIPEAFPDKSTNLLIYGDGDPFKADLAALGRLAFMGYTNVFVLDGGLTAWKDAGKEVSGQGKPESPAKLSGTFDLDTARTKVRWIGRNLMNQHNGEIAASAGRLSVSEYGIITQGNVSVDMAKMVCHDIPEKSVAGMLIEHLESADFFDVAHFPEASFTLDTVKPIEGATYGKPNHTVTGVLKARGVEAELEITALFEPIENGYVFQSVFDFDRTQIGALYGSGSIFERLGMHLVNDLVSLDVTAFFVKS
ncbi:MAG: YceI family protein [Verrucomicrobiota bacterium]